MTLCGNLYQNIKKSSLLFAFNVKIRVAESRCGLNPDIHVIRPITEEHLIKIERMSRLFNALTWNFKTILYMNFFYKALVVNIFLQLIPKKNIYKLKWCENLYKSCLFKASPLLVHCWLYFLVFFLNHLYSNLAKYTEKLNK